MQNSALSQSEAYARRLFYDSHVAQVVLDAASRRCVDCNQAAIRLYGVASRDDLMGRSPGDISAPVQYDGTASPEAIERVFAQLEIDGLVAFEWRHRKPDGQYWDASVHMMEFTLKGQRLAHLSVEDITQRKRDEEMLRELNQQLEDRVRERTQELAQTNAQLHTTLESLQRTQDELVQQEKLASLGALVAGVAHELNTPLGNSVTVSTSLESEVKILSQDIEQGTLKRSTLNRVMESLNSGLALLSRNLERASDLVMHFKQVAVDQTSDKRRKFDLAAVVTDVVETLEPQFKKTPHRITVQVPENIAMDSYPGPLGQVITNLAMNALIHGFSPEMQGEVVIAAEVSGTQDVVIRVTDNGCGIPEQYLSRVFDPFFTTRLGQGGSGLGLHIVFNIVVATLGGNIHLDTQIKNGASFVLRIPCEAPHRLLES